MYRILHKDVLYIPKDKDTEDTSVKKILYDWMNLVLSSNKVSISFGDALSIPTARTHAYLKAFPIPPPTNFLWITTPS